MASSTASYPINAHSFTNDVIPLPVKAAHRIDEGHMVMMATGTGYVECAVGATASVRCVGWCKLKVDNSGGAAGDLNAECSRQRASFAMKSGDEFTNAMIGATAYVDTSTTVKATAGSNAVTAGIFRGLDPLDSTRAIIDFS